MSIDNIQEYIESFGMFDEPVEYKELKLYPILTKDAHLFINNVDILRIDKNKWGDINIIQMSYLLFMLSLIQMDKTMMDKFLWLAEHIFGMRQKDKVLMKKYAPNELLVRQGANEDTYIYVVNGWDIAFEVCGQRATIFFDNIKLTATEFDEVRRIILYQNIYNYDDTPMSEDVKRVVEQYYTLKNKGIIPPSFAKKRAVVLSNSAETYKSIQDMPYRQFEELFHTIVDKIEYMVSIPLIPHLKDPDVEHWVYKKERGKFDGIFVDADNVANKTIK